MCSDTVKPVYNGHPWDHAEWLLYRGGLLIEVGGAYCIHGWTLRLILLAGIIEGDLPNQVAVSTGYTILCSISYRGWHPEII